MNKLVLVAILNFVFNVPIFGMGSDNLYFSITNNTDQNFEVEISYGAPANLASPLTHSKKPDVEIGEFYQDKQLLVLPSGNGLDIQKSQIRRYPMYIRLLKEAGTEHVPVPVFQLSDKTFRNQIAVGVDNVFQRTGLVINADPAGVLSYKYYDMRPDTKVIRPTHMLMDDDR